MPRREVWFAIPSANPALCLRTLPVWRERGYRVAVLQDRVRADIPADYVMRVDEYHGWAWAVNRLCAELLEREVSIVVSGGDDMLPDPDHSADEIARQFEERFPDGFGVMQPQGDTFGLAQHYCGSPWMGRGWIERMYGGAGPLWPEYRHNWADNELYWTARCLDALWVRPDLSQRHEHFSRDGGAAPEYWNESVARHDRADAELFVRRCLAGFPGHEPQGMERQFDRERLEREYRAIAEVHLAGRHGVEGMGEVVVGKMRGALDLCARRGLMRVGIYGAGMHTRVASPAFLVAEPRIVCVIDDNPSLSGESVVGLPIVTREEAMSLDLDGVVLSSNSAEESLAERAAGLAARGVQIVTLYTGSPIVGPIPKLSTT